MAYWLFVDESEQEHPARVGMDHKLISVGGLLVKDAFIQSTERAIAKNTHRSDFFAAVANVLRSNEAQGIVVVVDGGYRPPQRRWSTEQSAFMLVIERFQNFLKHTGASGIVLCDTPSGGRRDEHRFLADCVDQFRDGTDYVRFENFALQVLTAPSRYVRLLQAADVFTGCLLGYVAGESEFAPQTARQFQPLIRRHAERVNGYGVKIHPDARYVNLYRWLFDDSKFQKAGREVRLPIPSRPYSEGADQ